MIVTPPFDINRERMVDEQLIPRGIVDPATLAAMLKVPRHEFVEDAMGPRPMVTILCLSVGGRLSPNLISLPL